MSTTEKWQYTAPNGGTVTIENQDGWVDISPEAIAGLYAARKQSDSREGDVGALTLDFDILVGWLEELGYE